MLATERHGAGSKAARALAGSSRRIAGGDAGLPGADTRSAGTRRMKTPALRVPEGPDRPDPSAFGDPRSGGLPASASPRGRAEGGLWLALGAGVFLLFAL